MIAFADTGYYVALLNPRDRYHGIATECSKACRFTVVTTEYVLMELGNYLSGSARGSFLSLCTALREDAHTEIVPSSPALFGQVLDLYAKRDDKHWSLTDCRSIVVMQVRGIREALSFDHHFEQAGFSLIPSIR